MPTRLVVLLLALTLAFPAWAPAQAASLSVFDQAIQSGYITVDAVLADSDGLLVVTTSDGGTVLGQAPVRAGDNGRVRVKIDVTQATPELKAALHADLATPLTEGQPFKVVGISLIGIQEPPGAVSEVTIGRVIAQQDGWVGIRRVRPEPDRPPFFGVAPVTAGVNDNVTVEIDDPRSMIGWEIAAALYIDAGAAGQFEFPSPDLPVLLGGSVVDEPVGIGQTFIVPIDGALDGRLTVPLVGAPADGFLVLRTPGANSSVIGSAPVRAGLNADVVIEVPGGAPIDQEGGFLQFFQQMPSGALDAPDFNPDALPVLLVDGISVLDQSKAAIDALGGVVVARVVASRAGWIEVVSSASGLPTIAVHPVPAGLSQNLVIPLKPEDVSAGMTLLLHLNVDAGQIGQYEFPGPDERVKDSKGAVVRDGMVVK